MTTGPATSPPAQPIRWTAERQLRFLDALARTRSVTRAADYAGLSRESAYRLRGRAEGALFGALWDRAMQGHKTVNFARSRVDRIGLRKTAPHGQHREPGADAR